jgi:glycogen debranching enzyme
MSLPSQKENRDVIEVGQQFYIRASSSLADERTRVLHSADSFAIFDRSGNIQPVGIGQQGFFHKETRHLSRLELYFCGIRPILLSSTVREDNVLFGVDLTNPDMTLVPGESLPRGTLHIHRTKFLTDTTCYERIAVHNFGDRQVSIDISFEFDADFADIFEVRGEKRPRRGAILPARFESSAVTLGYEGLDGIRRTTRLECKSGSADAESGQLLVPLQVASHQEASFILTIECGRSEVRVPLPRFEDALEKLSRQRKKGPLADARIITSDERVNKWLRRSQADLEMMVTPTPFGFYPYAGVPWFSTVFGRDGIITALQLLWLAPEVARGVLLYLAETQATDFSAENDAEPGKILHEVRKGEMAELKEVPFKRYYGTIDATPLFLVLAAAYYERTADLEFIRSIWTNLLAANDWIDQYGDRDGDGFVEYARHADTGLVQQGWKDSGDSIFHSDGSLAQGPIALCEVQSYVFAAKQGMSLLAIQMGDIALSQRLLGEADKLRERFSAMFWSVPLSTFALALDGEKRQCQVRASNAGHCLFSGIASETQSRSVCESLLEPGFYSGWGIRTIASSESRYNPMSYHNGSVWPHDNAFIAWGSLRQRNKRIALRVLSGLLELSSEVVQQRLPELICGFARRAGKGPTLYPVACAPQAWASGAAFMTLQACLGMEIRALERRIYLHYSALPEWLTQVHITNLKIGDANVDLSFERQAESVGFHVQRRTGNVEIVAMV